MPKKIKSTRGMIIFINIKKYLISVLKKYLVINVYTLLNIKPTDHQTSRRQFRLTLFSSPPSLTYFFSSSLFVINTHIYLFILYFIFLVQLAIKAPTFVLLSSRFKDLLINYWSMCFVATIAVPLLLPLRRWL